MWGGALTFREQALRRGGALPQTPQMLYLASLWASRKSDVCQALEANKSSEKLGQAVSFWLVGALGCSFPAHTQKRPFALEAPCSGGGVLCL